jgi:quinol monooxygenase YgiN
MAVKSRRFTEGTLNYEWTLAEDGKSIHVYERYKDADATTAHLRTWASWTASA